MKPELEEQLAKKYQKLFVNKNKSPLETLICFGCECGDGWYKILDDLFAYLTELSERKFSLRYSDEYREKYKNEKDYYEKYYSYKHLPPQIILDQVKEKYATLRVYYHEEYNDVPEDIKPFVDLNELDKSLKDFFVRVDNAIDYAEFLSAKTCEVTGKDGKLYTKGWHRVLCDEEAIKMGYIPEEDSQKYKVEYL